MSRVEDSRKWETREASIMQAIQNPVQDFMNIPQHLIPEDMEYSWVVDTVFQDPAFSQIPHKAKYGWDPVPADRLPNMISKSVEWRQDSHTGYIHHKGSVLCERPKKFGQMEREVHRKASLKALFEAPANAELANDPTIRPFVQQHQLARLSMRQFKQDN